MEPDTTAPNPAQLIRAAVKKRRDDVVKKLSMLRPADELLLAVESAEAAVKACRGEIDALREKGDKKKASKMERDTLASLVEEEEAAVKARDQRSRVEGVVGKKLPFYHADDFLGAVVKGLTEPEIDDVLKNLAVERLKLLLEEADAPPAKPPSSDADKTSAPTQSNAQDGAAAPEKEKERERIVYIVLPAGLTSEDRLRQFYQAHMPDKDLDATAVLQKYEGREEALWKKLRAKYGPEPTYVAPPQLLQTQNPTVMSDGDPRSVNEEASVFSPNPPSAQPGASSLGDATTSSNTAVTPAPVTPEVIVRVEKQVERVPVPFHEMSADEQEKVRGSLCGNGAATVFTTLSDEERKSAAESVHCSHCALLRSEVFSKLQEQKAARRRKQAHPAGPPGHDNVHPNGNNDRSSPSDAEEKNKDGLHSIAQVLKLVRCHRHGGRATAGSFDFDTTPQALRDRVEQSLTWHSVDGDHNGPRGRGGSSSHKESASATHEGAIERELGRLRSEKTTAAAVAFAAPLFETAAAMNAPLAALSGSEVRRQQTMTAEPTTLKVHTAGNPAGVETPLVSAKSSFYQQPHEQPRHQQYNEDAASMNATSAAAERKPSRSSVDFLQSGTSSFGRRIGEDREGVAPPSAAVPTARQPFTLSDFGATEGQPGTPGKYPTGFAARTDSSRAPPTAAVPQTTTAPTKPSAEEMEAAAGGSLSAWLENHLTDDAAGGTRRTTSVIERNVDRPAATGPDENVDRSARPSSGKPFSAPKVEAPASSFFPRSMSQQEARPLGNRGSTSRETSVTQRPNDAPGDTTVKKSSGLVESPKDTTLSPTTAAAVHMDYLESTAPSRAQTNTTAEPSGSARDSNDAQPTLSHLNESHHTPTTNTTATTSATPPARRLNVFDGSALPRGVASAVDVATPRAGLSSVEMTAQQRAVLESTPTAAEVPDPTTPAEVAAANAALRQRLAVLKEIMAGRQRQP